MITAATNKLKDKVNSTYTLCNIIGKRARQLVDGAVPLTECNCTKPVSIAAKEVSEGKITYTQNKSVIKEKSNIDTRIFESCI